MLYQRFCRNTQTAAAAYDKVVKQQAVGRQALLAIFSIIIVVYAVIAVATLIRRSDAEIRYMKRLLVVVPLEHINASDDLQGQLLSS